MIYTLCRGKGCCPTVVVTEENVKIKDDNGNIVVLSPKQYDILKELIVTGKITKDGDSD
jgi:hypothetical protein